MVYPSVLIVLVFCAAGAAQSLPGVAVSGLVRRDTVVTASLTNRSGNTITAYGYECRTPDREGQQPYVVHDIVSTLNDTMNPGVKVFGPGQTKTMGCDIPPSGIVPEFAVTMLMFSDRTWVGDRKLVELVLQQRRPLLAASRELVRVLGEAGVEDAADPRAAATKAVQSLRELAGRPAGSAEERRTASLLRNFAGSIELAGRAEDEWDVAASLKRYAARARQDVVILERQAYPEEQPAR